MINPSTSTTHPQVTPPSAGAEEPSMDKLQTSEHSERAETSRFITAILVIGLGSLFSTLLIYSGTVISFLRFEQAETFMGTFAETTLLAATLIGALFVGIALAGKKLPFRLLSALGALCYLCSSLAFVSFAWFGSYGGASVVALAVVVALSDLCLALSWGRLCARFKIKRALVVVSLASIVSACLCTLYSTLPLPGVTVLFVLASIVAVIVPLACFDATRHGKQEPSSTQETAGETRTTVASLAGVIAAPGLGLIVFAFVMALMRTSFSQSQNAYFAMLVLDAIALLAYALLRKKPFSLRGSMHQTFLPLMAMILLAATSIASTIGQGFEVVTYLTYALYALAAILTLATLCGIAHAGEFSSDLVFSLAVLLFAAASFFGQSFASYLDDGLVHVAVTVTTTLYAFAMVLTSYVGRQSDVRWANDERKPSREATENLPQETWTSAAAPEDPCERLATTYKLTAREQEILSFLAEGHSGSYISDVLFISPNTARTHIHNIYRKLEVSSREDILRMTKK